MGHLDPKRHRLSCRVHECKTLPAIASSSAASCFKSIGGGLHSSTLRLLMDTFGSSQSTHIHEGDLLRFRDLSLFLSKLVLET